MSLYVPCYRPYNKHNTNIHAPGGIRTRSPSKRTAADPRLILRDHWDRLGVSGIGKHVFSPVNASIKFTLLATFFVLYMCTLFVGRNQPYTDRPTGRSRLLLLNGCVF
jgi:hypothetical protein